MGKLCSQERKSLLMKNNYAIIKGAKGCKNVFRETLSEVNRDGEACVHSREAGKKQSESFCRFLPSVEAAHADGTDSLMSGMIC